MSDGEPDSRVRSTPTTRERALREAAATLTPARALDAVDAASSRLTTAVTLAATLSGGLGLVSATQLQDVGIGWALPAVIAAAGSVLLAVLATVPVKATLRPGDLPAVEAWFDQQLSRRIRLIHYSAVTLALALLFAALPAVVAAVQQDEPAIAVRVASSRDAKTISVSATNLPDGATMRARVVQDGRAPAELFADAGDDGAADISTHLERARGTIRIVAEAADGDTVLTRRDVTVR
jgi:hypothetical protein